jgi:hypothetical protein
MRTLIVFREGLSGHFVKSLINDKPVESKFRMDPWWPGIYDQIEEQRHDHVVCCHPRMFDDSILKNFGLVLNIQVERELYPAAYNVFCKKMLVEEFTQAEFDLWRDNLVFWYDKAYYNIKQYLGIFRTDLANNHYENVLEFDRLLDVDYIESVFIKYYDRPLTDNMRGIVEGYKNKQVGISMPLEGTTMSEIIAPIPDDKFTESPWFAAYAIYKFEVNNGLAESQRLWSIDTVTSIIDRNFLLDIASKYTTTV